MIPHHLAQVAQGQRRAIALFSVMDGHFGQILRPDDGQDVLDREPLIGGIDEPAHARLRCVRILQ